MRFRCQDCMQKVASFGFTYDKRRRWCGSCRRSHIGAEDVVHRKCEVCKNSRPVFGMPDDGRRRWCCACAKNIAGSVNINLLQKAKAAPSGEACRTRAGAAIVLSTILCPFVKISGRTPFLTSNPLIQCVCSLGQ